ncbi:MAG: hypothetical protein OXF67_02765 [Cyanobacteria bacterium MAG CAR4_bin_6]|nr:hypothetical protein [Cyanobacteria bacterium MAG CAR4_bin_6]
MVSVIGILKNPVIARANVLSEEILLDNVTAEHLVTRLVGGEILYNAANGGISTITGFVSRGKGLVNGYISEFYTEDAYNYSSSSEIKIESVKYLYFEPAAITIPASDP